MSSPVLSSMLSGVEFDVESNVEFDVESSIELNVESSVEFDVESGVEFDVESRVEFDVESGVEFDVESSVESYLDLDLVPPTPAGASGDELSPFHTVVGGFGCAVPRHAHLVEVFSKCLSPGLFWPSLFPPAHSWCPCNCYLCRSLLWQTQYVPRESSPSFDHYVLQVPHFSHLHQFFICDVVSPGYAEYRPQTPAVEYVKSVGDASRLFPGFAGIDCGWQDNGLV